MTEILLPVGQPLGWIDDPHVDPPISTIRVGRRFLELSSAQYQMWMLALHCGTLDAVAVAAERDGLTDVLEEADTLVANDLLLSLKPSDALEAKLSHLCLLPMGYGLGRSTEFPGHLVIAGSDGQVRSEPPPHVFMAWSQGPHVDLWAICKLIAEEEGLDPEPIAADLVDGVSGLLASGCAFVDAVP